MSSRAQASTASGGPRRRTSGERGQTAPSIVAVVSVVAIVGALVVFFAGGGGDDAATRPQAQTESVTSPTPTRAEPEQATPTARATQRGADAKGRERAKQRKADQDKREKRARGSRPEPEPEGPPQVYVEVYNNTSVSGLAASTAAELQDGGWQVVGVDNWYGEIPASTVYYPDGMYDEANQLAEALGIGRVRTAVAPMKFDRLTVILTPDAA